MDDEQKPPTGPADDDAPHQPLEDNGHEDFAHDAPEPGSAGDYHDPLLDEYGYEVGDDGQPFDADGQDEAAHASATHATDAPPVAEPDASLDDDLAFDPAQHAADDDNAHDDEYQFLDDDEVSELELDEQESTDAGIMAKIRGRVEPLIGEDNFDRLKGMAIPIIVAAVFVIFAASKLASLFSTPTRPAAQATVQTQITPVQTPKPTPLVTTDIIRPGSQSAAETKADTGADTAGTPAKTDMPDVPGMASAPADTPASMPGSGTVVPPGQAAPPASGATISSFRALLGSDDKSTQFQLQPGQPGYTAAVPAVSEDKLKAITDAHAAQSEKFTQQLDALDAQTKGVDERLLRVEKMQATLDKKMSNINTQLESVGKSMAMLSKSLKEQPKRSQFVTHSTPTKRSASAAPGAGMHADEPLSTSAYAQPAQQYRPGRHSVAKGMAHSPVGVSFETPYYHVEAVVPGRAWLKDQHGTTVTVGKGDQIRGYGYVTFIDSENGLVVTSSGIVIRYGIDTR